ncbi:hypothetical protein GCM10022223_54430 [Kineosporia mesophila]|uniref:Transposase n=1 Tax=Kineosporia mesophila TaxID=566012 RepID=A0ABP7ADN1_9ACTN
MHGQGSLFPPRRIGDPTAQQLWTSTINSCRTPGGLDHAPTIDHHAVNTGLRTRAAIGVEHEITEAVMNSRTAPLHRRLQDMGVTADHDARPRVRQKIAPWKWTSPAKASRARPLPEIFFITFPGDAVGPGVAVVTGVPGIRVPGAACDQT